MRIIFTLILMHLAIVSGFACSGINKTINGKTLTGYNLDYINPYTRIEFLPGNDNEYGVVLLGMGVSPAQGINEEGLVVDQFSRPVTNSNKSNEKISYKGNLVLKILKECASVNEALDLLSKYNLDMLNTQQIKIVDKTGDSVILEGDIQHRKDSTFQVVTNFNLSEVKNNNISCFRYLSGSKLIKESDLSIKSYEEILDKMKMREYSSWKTIHSYIFDHNKGDIHLYLFGDFSSSYIFNIKEELSKGKAVYDIPSLFNNIKHKKYVEKYLSTKPKIITVDPSILKEYVGTYMAIVDNTQEIILKDGKLYLSIAGNNYEMYAYKEDEFFFKKLHFNLKFLTNDLGITKGVKFVNGTFGIFEGEKIK